MCVVWFGVSFNTCFVYACCFIMCVIVYRVPVHSTGSKYGAIYLILLFLYFLVVVFSIFDLIVCIYLFMFYDCNIIY